jgi:hypothetical protein
MDAEQTSPHDTSSGGFLRWRRRHALPPGSACRNCATELRGPWCHQCGQLGEDFHRSAHHLIGEVFEAFFHADGRVLRTLPRLALHPGVLTRDYLLGRRAPQIPPFRLFLTMLLVLFLVGSAVQDPDIAIVGDHGTPAERAEAKAELAKANFNIATGLGPHTDQAITAWLKARLPQAIDRPDVLVSAMGEWAHRFAFLTLPISALLLSIIFAFRRDTYLFDHLIFSMHSLSFQGLLVALVMATWHITGHRSGLLLFASPVHLYAHMHGTYGTGRAGTLVRMSVLFIVSSVAFALLLLGLVLVGLNALGGA